MDPWLDEEKLLPGQDWDAEIKRALQESDAIFICLSRTSVSREGYVHVEIKEALENAKKKPFGAIFVIPAKLDDCEVPSYLKTWHWVELFVENGYEHLMRSLRRRAGEVGASIDPLEDRILEQRLEELYTEGLAAFHTEDWDKAYHCLKIFLRERPDHLQAAQRLDEVSRQKHLKTLYTEALEAQESEDWQAAVKFLDKLTNEAADYKDAAALLELAQKKKQVIDLYNEARRPHKAEQWQAVIVVLAKIAAIDPNYPDMDRLSDTANQRAVEAARHAELNELYGRAVREIDSSNWQTAHKLLKQIRKIKFGFLETERLLFKVEAEIRKAKRQSYILQRISLSSKWVKLLLIISSVVLGILFLLSGLPVKYSPSQGKPTFLYSTPDSLVHKGNLRIPPGESFYLC